MDSQNNRISSVRGRGGAKVERECMLQDYLLVILNNISYNLDDHYESVYTLVRLVGYFCVLKKI